MGSHRRPLRLRLLALATSAKRVAASTSPSKVNGDLNIVGYPNPQPRGPEIYLSSCICRRQRSLRIWYAGIAENWIDYFITDL
ncbi:hypothetical protein CRG98_026536 [Punica granatum]|uniref:Uncharacterized protein n=1 Tax=Punica granatum TaxID=22663 RepID=A0A2I0J9Y5_PUNGR|nr:hypothetical protein CRG98_026536 [Punica granatum]